MGHRQSSKSLPSQSASSDEMANEEKNIWRTSQLHPPQNSVGTNPTLEWLASVKPVFLSDEQKTAANDSTTSNDLYVYISECSESTVDKNASHQGRLKTKGYGNILCKLCSGDMGYMLTASLVKPCLWL